MQGKLEVDSQQFEVEARRENEAILVTMGGKEFAVTLQETEEGFTAQIGEEELHIEVTEEQKDQLRLSRTTDISVDGHLVPTLFRPQRNQEEGSMTALMPGTVIRILVEEGQEVSTGEVLLILEAMKMENEIKAPLDGLVETIPVEAGKAVNKGDLLILLSEKQELP